MNNGGASVVVPEPFLQAAIVAPLDRETARLDGIAQAIRAQTQKVREYRQALLSAAVTGKMDVRGGVRLPAIAGICRKLPAANAEGYNRRNTRQENHS